MKAHSVATCVALCGPSDEPEMETGQDKSWRKALSSLVARMSRCWLALFRLRGTFPPPVLISYFGVLLARGILTRKLLSFCPSAEGSFLGSSCPFVRAAIFSPYCRLY